MGTFIFVNENNDIGRHRWAQGSRVFSALILSDDSRKSATPKSTERNNLEKWRRAGQPIISVIAIETKRGSAKGLYESVSTLHTGYYACIIEVLTSVTTYICQQFATSKLVLWIQIQNIWIRIRIWIRVRIKGYATNFERKKY